MEYKRTFTVNDLTAGYLRRNYIFGIDLIDQFWNKLGDEELQGHIDNQLVDLEQKSGVRLTSTRVYTPPNQHNVTEEGKVLGVDYDEIGEAIDFSWIEQKNWGQITLPESNIIEMTQIRAIFQHRAIWTVPESWIKLRKQGYVNIVPALTGELCPQMVGHYEGAIIFAGHQLNIGLTNTYPQYWACDYKYGVPNIPRNVCDWVMLSAAMIILEQYATAFNPGISSKSISLGSIFSSSETYTASAMFSLMSAQIETYRKRLGEINTNDIQRQLKGGMKVFTI